METPEIGSKFRHPKFPRKVFGFIGEKHKGDIVYWSFVDINSGKAKFFYPDEVFPVDSKRTLHRKATPSVVNKPVIEAGRESKEITVGGDTITVI